MHPAHPTPHQPDPGEMPSFDELVAEAQAAGVTGWGSGFLDGRATEERPPWGYLRTISARLPQVGTALDLDAGMRAGEPFVAHSTRHLVEARPPR